MGSPTFEIVDLTELQDAGVLMAANERFFWPLGLALTWDQDKETGTASNLHVREWRWEDGHHEAIELGVSDEIGTERRARFKEWLAERLLTMPIDNERESAASLLESSDG